MLMWAWEGGTVSWGGSGGMSKLGARSLVRGGAV